MFQVDGEPTPSGIGRPRRLTGVKEYPIGEDLLIYPSHGQAVVSINPFATAVWELCDGSTTIFEISQQVEHYSKSGRAQRFLDVEAAVMHLFKEGLIEFEENSIEANAIGYSGLQDCPGRCVGLGDQQVVVQSKLQEVLDHVERRFAPMLVSEEATRIAWLEIRSSADGEYVLLKNGAGVREDKRLVDSLYYLEGEIVQSFMAHRSELIWFHAGAAARHRRGLLIVGPAGAGKSTIVSRLCESGWSYLSDEVAPVNVEAGLIVPFPQAPLVRETSERNLSAEGWRKLSKLEEKIDPGLVCGEPVAVGALVFPVFDADSPTALSCCSASEAALYLLENCHSFGSHGERAVQAVAKMAEIFPAYRLSYDSGRSAVQLLVQSQKDWDLE